MEHALAMRFDDVDFLPMTTAGENDAHPDTDRDTLQEGAQEHGPQLDSSSGITAIDHVPVLEVAPQRQYSSWPVQEPYRTSNAPPISRADRQKMAAYHANNNDREMYDYQQKQESVDDQQKQESLMARRDGELFSEPNMERERERTVLSVGYSPLSGTLNTEHARLSDSSTPDGSMMDKGAQRDAGGELGIVKRIMSNDTIRNVSLTGGTRQDAGRSPRLHVVDNPHALQTKSSYPTEMWKETGPTSTQDVSNRTTQSASTPTASESNEKETHALRNSRDPACADVRDKHVGAPAIITRLHSESTRDRDDREVIHDVIDQIQSLQQNSTEMRHSRDDVPHSNEEVRHSRDDVPHSNEEVRHSREEVPHSNEDVLHCNSGSLHNSMQRVGSVHLSAAPHAIALDCQASFTTAQPAAPSLDEQAALNIDLRFRHTKQLEAQRLNYENQIALLTKTAKEDLAAFVGEMKSNVIMATVCIVMT